MRGLNYFICNILPKRLSLEIKKLHSETKNAQCMLNVNCSYKTIRVQLKECITCIFYSVKIKNLIKNLLSLKCK